MTGKFTIALAGFCLTTFSMSASFAQMFDTVDLASNLPADAVALFNPPPVQPVDFGCTCRALDDSNPSIAAACAALSVGVNCGRVGNIICIPACH